MLFNSYIFIFLFLPITLLVFFQLGRLNHAIATTWLAAASLFFYGWWNPAYVGLLLISICFNYVFSMWISTANVKNQPIRKKRLLVMAIAVNLLMLVYYKYANFFLSSVGSLAGTHWELGNIILPLGISFFTFTQIAFLVDTYQGKVKEYNFVHYGLFVTYFPHLIAGPVLHHKEMMPQFGKASTYKLDYENIAVGLTVFSIGLFKKVILADGVAPYVAPLFDNSVGAPTMLEAWGGALAYTFQLYFDFSGYSDMAIGLSILFGIRLPLNFHSPYKAVNIIDFWRCWHMTLSRFLRDYLYIPLGGSRKGPFRRYINLMATMLLGGLWHGAGWSFVVGAGLHGLYLTINHAWHAFRNKLGQDINSHSLIGTMLGRLITFVAVVVAWVFFRAGSLDVAMGIIKGMVGMNGIILPEMWLPKFGIFGQWLMNNGINFGNVELFGGMVQIYWIATLLMISWFMPNTQQFMGKVKIALDMPSENESVKPEWFRWRPNLFWAIVLAAMTTYSLFSLTKVSEFLYFQF